MFEKLRRNKHKAEDNSFQVHIDEPAPDAALSRAQTIVRGWVTLPKDGDPSDVSISLQIDDQVHPVLLQERADVAKAFPSRRAIGFTRHVDLNDVRPGAVQMTLRVSYDANVHEELINVVLAQAAAHNSNYFHLQPREYDNGALRTLADDHRRSWTENGFIHIRNFLSKEEVKSACSVMDGIWENRKTLNWKATVDQFVGTPEKQRVLLANASDDIRSEPYKINDLYLASEKLRPFLLNERISTLLSSLMYGGTPMICSSLYFEKGSQQEKHFDTFFMAPLIRNRMLATWIALEDVTDANGPLLYYPGSHNIEPYRFADGSFALNPDERSDCYRYIDREIENRSLPQKTLNASAGDMFIWHAQLLHGGHGIENHKQTRRSLVTHYFCEEDHRTGDCREFAPGLFYLDRDYLTPGEFSADTHRYV